MCTGKTDDKSKTAACSCCEEMNEMINKIFPESEGASNFWDQMKQKCSHCDASSAECMTMFQQMKNTCCEKVMDTSRNKSKGCCA